MEKFKTLHDIRTNVNYYYFFLKKKKQEKPHLTAYTFITLTISSPKFKISQFLVYQILKKLQSYPFIMIPIYALNGIPNRD
jgi:hypothetical protein